MVVLIAVFVAFTLWSTKAPILVLYVKLFGVRTWLRWLSYLTLVVTGLNFLGSFILPVVQCDTGMTTPDPAIFLICQNATVTGGIWSGFVSIIEDVIIFCMPIPAILQLNLPTAKKVGVILVFFSGIMLVSPPSPSYHHLFSHTDIDSQCNRGISRSSGVQMAIYGGILGWDTDRCNALRVSYPSPLFFSSSLSTKRRRKQITNEPRILVPSKQTQRSWSAAPLR